MFLNNTLLFSYFSAAFDRLIENSECFGRILVMDHKYDFTIGGDDIN
jgi:hypothetical protein